MVEPAEDIAGEQDSAQSELAQRMRDLLARGADHFDPVGFRFIESLWRRCQSLSGPVKAQLEQKLTYAIATYCKRLELAASEGRAHLVIICKQHPETATQAQHYFDSGDFAAVRRLRHQLDHGNGHGALKALTGALQSLPPSVDDEVIHTLSFEAILNQQEQAALHSSGHWSAPRTATKGNSELKTVRLFKSTWAKLSTEKRVAKVIECAPKEAGPLNSQTLVIRSLAMLRDISPEYLSRFVTYTDTLLWLEKAGSKPEPVAEKPATSKTKGKSTKSPSAKSQSTKSKKSP